MTKFSYQMSAKEFQDAHPITGDEQPESLTLFTAYQRRLQAEGDKRSMGMIMLDIFNSSMGTGNKSITSTNNAYRKAIVTQALYEGLDVPEHVLDDYRSTELTQITHGDLASASRFTEVCHGDNEQPRQDISFFQSGSGKIGAIQVSFNEQFASPDLRDADSPKKDE